MTTAKRATAKKTTARKQPADRLPPKRVRDDQPIGGRDTNEGYRVHLEVTIDGDTYRSTDPLTEIVTAGMIRKNRTDDMGFFFALMERAFADQTEVIEAFDEMPGHELGPFAETVMAEVQHLVEGEQEVDLGESERS